MNNNKINIISFDIPLPADYGGVIDVFYKMKELHDSGYEIILHCFSYGRLPQPELEKYCKKVFYYKRGKGIKYLFSNLPYITITRANKNLLQNLKQNNYPILFEGLHSCFFINTPELSERNKIIRMHNIEHEYYAELAKATKKSFKKLFFKIESAKLKKYEKIVSYANSILAISKNDFNYFRKQHKNVKLIPAFHPLQSVQSKTGKGKYFLYHGNLSVEENEKAVLFLIDNVFINAEIQFVIAGKSPTKIIQSKIKDTNNIVLEENPSETEMNELIMNAHCCVLPTFQTTGLKLKLLISLFLGRHLIVNSEMVENTGLESLCEIAIDKNDFINEIDKIKGLEFSEENISQRKIVLEKFTNTKNCKTLINELNNE